MIEINSSLWTFSFVCGNLFWRVEQIEAGMSGGPAYGGWQHCRGEIPHMFFFVNVAQVGFCKLEALRSFYISRYPLSHSFLYFVL